MVRNGKPIWKMNGTGVNDGLTLNVDLRHYNYSDSPNTDAGIKILLHSQDEPLHPDRFGVAASPGTISYVH